MEKSSFLWVGGRKVKGFFPRALKNYLFLDNFINAIKRKWIFLLDRF